MYSIKYFDHNTIQHIQYNVHAYNKSMHKYIVVKDHKVHVIYIINIIDKIIHIALQKSFYMYMYMFWFNFIPVQVLFSFVSGYGNIW